ncbi:MAG: hypothetical protein LBE22_00645 [Azoarcus sp.]|jgi:hypothetical protein|nr:hypothetical protein [Azoarcus sp.]
MYAVQKTRMLICGLAAAVMLCGCQDDDLSPEAKVHIQRLNKWKLVDWLHDIDAAKAVLEAERRGDLGTLSPDLAGKLELAWRADNMSSSGSVADCWPRWKQGDPTTKTMIDTAHTDHACLDAAGYKRGK